MPVLIAAPAAPDWARLADSLATAVVVLDTALEVVTVNAAAEGLLGSSRRQLAGQPVASVLRPPATLTGRLERAVAEGAGFLERTARLGTPHGEPLVADLTVTPLVDDERVDGLVLELADAGARERLARESLLLDQTRLAGAVVQGLAHEVKNPLGGIRGAAQLLERELDHESQREYTRLIIGEADRLGALIDALSAPARPARRSLVNVHEVLEHVRGLVEAERQGRLQVAVDYDPSLPELRACRDELVQLFLNLVRNAVQAVGEAGGEVAIRTRAERQVTIGGERHRLTLRIDVIDTGPGVPEELGEGIFYPMVSGRAEGTGLGLSIAQTLAQRAGGVVRYRREGERTVFSVWLPVNGDGSRR